MHLLKKKILLSALMLIFGVGMISNQAIAQEQQKDTAKLYGKIIDKSSDKALSDIEVVITPANETATMSETSGQSGVYAFQSLEPGTYTATVEADGYKSWEKEVEVTADGKMLEIKLKPSAQESS